jgi:ComF family protein
LLRLKYSKDIGLSEMLARHLIQLKNGLPWQIDVVTCVPLSRGRFKNREYNQAAMLARPLALAIHRPFAPLLLRKTREAPTQVGLSAGERWKNVEGAFAAGDKAILSARVILVVDDVTTTGSTMNACARVLTEAGAAAVYGLTFARAGLHDPIANP